MLEPNHEVQRRWIARQLKQHIAEGSFASRTYNAIGSQLHFILVEWPFESEVEFSRHDPMGELHRRLLGGWTFDLDWVATQDGRYVDDSWAEVPADVPVSCSSVELLAAYGLWLIEVEFFAVGAVPDGEHNDRGFSCDRVLLHRGTCVQLACEAALHINGLIRGEQPTSAEIEEAVKSEMARRAVRSKLAKDPKQAAKAFVYECWMEWRGDPQRYKSASAFARDMLDKQPVLENEVVVTRWVRTWSQKAD